MIKAADIKAEITALANPEKARVLSRFFKTGKGEYGYGDKFLGIAVPQVRGVAKRHAAAIPLDEIVPLLADGYHEIRLCALLLAVCRYAVKKPVRRKGEDIPALYRQYPIYKQLGSGRLVRPRYSRGTPLRKRVRVAVQVCGIRRYMAAAHSHGVDPCLYPQRG